MLDRLHYILVRDESLALKVKMKLERVILSSDFSPKFLNFLPLASFFWNKHFGIRPDLGLVVRKSNSSKAQAVAEKFSRIANFHILETKEDADLGNQAKLARLYLASTLDSDWSIIEDIDSVHVRPDFLLEKFSQASRNKLMAVGRETYAGTDFAHTFPMGTLSGASVIFSRITGAPQGVASFEEFIRGFRGLKVFTDLEDPYSPPEKFRDEHLLAALIEKRNLSSYLGYIQRGSDPKTDWVDRKPWPRIQRVRSNLDTIERVNFPRPYWENRRRINRTMRVIDADSVRGNEIPLPMTMIRWRLSEMIRR